MGHMNQNHMMRTDSEIWRDYWSIKGAKDSGFPCFFIEYKDLVTHTPDVISSLYEFLEIDSYDHDYEKLNLFNIDGIKYDDTFVGCEPNFIRTNGIQFNKYNLNKYLSKDILNICRTLNFWKDDTHYARLGVNNVVVQVDIVDNSIITKFRWT